MNKNLKTVLIVIFAVLIMLTAALAVLYLVRGDDEATNTNTSNSNVNAVENTNSSVTVNTNANTNAAANTNVDTVQGIDITEDSQLLSETFAERYGSFSTDTDFANIEGLYIYMTDSYKTSQQASVATQRANASSESYGVTTNVITTALNTTNESYAKYTHETRRVKTRIGEDDNAYNQTIVIELQYTDNGWRVNNATWKN